MCVCVSNGLFFSLLFEKLNQILWHLLYDSFENYIDKLDCDWTMRTEFHSTHFSIFKRNEIEFRIV